MNGFKKLTFIAYYVLIVAVLTTVIASSPFSRQLGFAATMSVIAMVWLLPELKVLLTKNSILKFNATRTVMSVLSLIAAFYFIAQHGAALEALLTPEQRQARDTQQQIERQFRAAREERLQRVEAEKQFQAELDKEHQARQAVKSAEADKQLALNNKKQEAFYATLAAPKILFKCTGKATYFAFGATYGTYNVLLAKAISECGQDRVDVLDKAQ